MHLQNSKKASIPFPPLHHRLPLIARLRRLLARIPDIFPQIPDHIKGIFSGGQSVPHQTTPHDCPGPPGAAQEMSIDRIAMFDAQVDGE
jgi:hypothetical protein